jgi:hypothetical protein
MMACCVENAEKQQYMADLFALLWEKVKIVILTTARTSKSAPVQDDVSSAKIIKVTPILEILPYTYSSLSKSKPTIAVDHGGDGDWSSKSIKKEDM